MSADHALRMEDEIATLASTIDAATHRLLTLIREFDAAEGWAGHGVLSCAHWLTWRIGLAPGVAREKVRVARALGDLPLIDDALRRGVISYSKVRAMTRVATRENEDALLTMATAGTAAHLERICGGIRQQQRAAAATPMVDTDRWVTHRQTEDGLVQIQAQLLPDEAALVMAAIEAVRNVSAETPRMGRADALVQMAEQILSAQSAPAKDDAATGSAPGRSARPAGDRHQIIVHLALDALDTGYRAELEDGTHVPAETLRRLACDSGLVPVEVDAKGRPLNVGRKTRAIPPALRRALALRDRGCRFPGCTHTRFVDAHHIEHWFHGGETKLDNLVLLCTRHHRSLHEEGFTLETGEDGELIFRNRKGQDIDAVPPARSVPGDALAQLDAHNRDTGVHISARTGLAHWDGSRPDYNACVAAAS